MPNNDSAIKSGRNDAPEQQAAAHTSAAPDRRSTILALGKFAAFVAPMTMVLIDADQAKANHCSGHSGPGQGGGLCP